MKFNVLYFNTLGTLFDKVLPLIITLLLSPFISSSDFGEWALYYQFLLFSNAVVISPLLGFFNRKFFDANSPKKMVLYNYPILLVLFVSCLVVYYTFFAYSISNLWYEVFVIIGFIAYNYYTQYLRFKEQDRYYLYVSLGRLIVFCTYLVYSKYLNEIIVYKDLLIAMALAHILVLCLSIFNMKLSPEKKLIETKEFLSLSFYGFFTSSINGIDKFVIVALGFSSQSLGIYSYFLSVAATPNLLVEIAKKIFTPLQFKEFSMFGEITKETTRKINLFLVGLFFLQIIIPQIVFIVLRELNLINQDFLAFQSPILLLFIFSIGLYIFSIYHFINPVLIYFKKSIFMSISLFVSVVVYLLLMYMFSDAFDIILFSFIKSIMLTIAVIITWLFVKKVRKWN
ncbi:hypothetical protein [Nonlabens tegetincola]|uniref:hypothetical protein n=1 Tax=Nonlabens tegetincola TaxID=323273 RepID=UPI000CF50C7D|nr:hypothetical protein [Nonlabens tegetincola]PQJ18520.1 hypothetical protein BST93_08525 [Nonlabens tegetincola]